MELTKKELQKVHKMVGAYKEKYDEITNLEKTLKILNDTRNQIKETLDNIRKEEGQFGEYLIEKYGKGKFNIQTFEYELEEQK